MSRPRHLRALAVAAVSAALLAGCGSGTGLSSDGNSGNSGSDGMTTSTSTMAMSMGSGQSSPATHVIATTDWQQMKIQVGWAKPITLYEPGDAGGSTVASPASHASFELTVALTDRDTGVALPYATVQATVASTAGRAIQTAQLLPVISPATGSYYGLNVTLPGRGAYTLALSIRAPDQARHVEYAHLWNGVHRVVEHFQWPG